MEEVLDVMHLFPTLFNVTIEAVMDLMFNGKYNKGPLQIRRVHSRECKTEMPNEFKFGKIQVSCEGYDYPDDPFILAGSCGMEYTIDRTGVNQGHHNNNQGHGGNSYSSNGWNNGKGYTGIYSDL